MELFRTDHFYIFISGEHSLWFDRFTGQLTPKSGWDLVLAEDPECIGICHGIVGKIENANVFDTRLMIIKECSPVGHIHGNHVVYKIKSIAFLQLGPENPELNLQLCNKHRAKEQIRNLPTIPPSSTTVASSSSIFSNLPKNTALTKTWGALKSAGTSVKHSTQQAAALASNQVKSKVKGKETRNNLDRDRTKLEKRIVDELNRIFTDTDSFYFSRTSDLTNSLQRQCDLQKTNQIDEKALWKTVDDRFFWNKHMLHDLISFNNSLADPWILPIIQGYVQIEHCKVEVGIENINDSPEARFETFTLSIISRRSRFRAGTRYKRRGVDEQGYCANYVETEQMITYHHHQVSFVQVRGSVPVYWSQPGFKYRPPPQIDRGEDETQVAFEKHFNNELQMYGPVCIVNLVDQTGKEKIIFDAYSQHIFKYNNSQISYATFDFHEYCRGMHFENVTVLINAIAEIIRDMNYCWKDKEGQICSQTGIFRVNCMDCLDRTNVVQTALAKAVMEIQFTKLGLIPPEGVMPASIRNTFQLLWANNGDIISKQYAGTNALKGDYTRTGERKFTGIMKDGVNSANRYLHVHFMDIYRQFCLDMMHGNTTDLNELSKTTHIDDLRTVGNIASELMPVSPPSYIPELAFGLEIQLAQAMYHMARYYLSRFKDAYRQGTIDIMLGVDVSDTIFLENRTGFDEDATINTEHVKLLIEDCKKLLIPDPELVLGAWGLIDADPSNGDPMETEMDTIVILTKNSYYVADYDYQIDKVNKYQRVLLKDVTLLEYGLSDNSGLSLFKGSFTKPQHHCIRINYKVNGVEGYYHMFRATNLRFFNNMAVVIKNDDEAIESLKAICESFIVAFDLCNLPPIEFYQGQRLDRRKSKIVGGSSTYLDITNFPHLNRNVSETQLLALKTVGSKALTNVSEQFSKLNRFGQSFNTKKSIKSTAAAKFTVGNKSTISKDDLSSTDSEEDCDISIFQPQGSENEANPQFASPTDDPFGRTGHSAIRVQSATADKHESSGVVSPDTFLPSVGIVMSSKITSEATNDEITLEIKENMTRDQTDVNNVCLSSVVQTVSLQPELRDESDRSVTPEITISSNDPIKATPPNSLKLDRKLSHSSSEVDQPNPAPINTSSTSQQTLTQPTNNISQSQSESALKHIKSITSPVGFSNTKELVLSPFSKLAKGVQNLGANLDPRKIAKGGVGQQGGPVVRQITEREYEEHRKLQEKWRKSNTRLIAL